MGECEVVTQKNLFEKRPRGVGKTAVRSLITRMRESAFDEEGGGIRIMGGSSPSLSGQSDHTPQLKSLTVYKAHLRLPH